MIADKKYVYENFENLLEDSVRIRMRSDVPYGAFLSGGLDSGSVVALMSRISKERVKTFTIGSREKMFDESSLALEVARKFNTDHHEYTVDHDSFDQALRKVMHHFDEPFGDSSALPTGEVSKAAVQKVKMVLTGDGGDEVLSGYNSNLVEKFAEQYRHLPSFLRSGFPAIVSLAANLFTGNNRYRVNQAAKALSFSDKSFNERLMAKSWCNPELSEQLIVNGVKQIKLSEFLDDFFSEYNVKHPFYKLMFFQFKVLLPDDFLVKVDRMSMAVSLETRVPFLDYRLVELMLRVHRDIKMQGYERKSVLRHTIGKKLPPSLLKAPKRGFSIPLREWFKGKEFNERLHKLYSADFGLNTKIIRQLAEKNNSGKEDYGNLLWMLFVYKQWIDGTK